MRLRCLSFHILVAVSDAGCNKVENRETPKVQEGAFDIDNRRPFGIHAHKPFHAPCRWYEAAQYLPYDGHTVIGPGNAADEEENHRGEDDDEENAFPFADEYRQRHSEEYRREQERCHEGVNLPLAAQLRVIEEPGNDVQHVHGCNDVEAVITDGFAKYEVQDIVAYLFAVLVVVPQFTMFVKSAGQDTDAENKALLHDDDEQGGNYERGKSAGGL